MVFGQNKLSKVILLPKISLPSTNLRQNPSETKVCTCSFLPKKGALDHPQSRSSELPFGYFLKQFVGSCLWEKERIAFWNTFDLDMFELFLIVLLQNTPEWFLRDARLFFPWFVERRDPGELGASKWLVIGWSHSMCWCWTWPPQENQPNQT